MFIDEIKKYKKVSIVALLVMVVFLFVLVFGNSDSKDVENELANLKNQTELLQKQLEEEKKKSLETKNLTEGEELKKEELKTEEIKPPVEGKKKQEERFKVLNVVDGDTLAVEINGQKEVLRLIGINTPETVDPRKPVECFGNEASNKAKEILTGKMVKLEEDVTQGNLDKYNRLLRYVYLEDGTNFNKLMIEKGYAYEYTYNTPYKYQTDFKAAQEKAQREKRGLWADDTCSGELNKKTEATPVAPTTNNTPTIAAPVVVGSAGGYSCSCSKTCPQMESCTEAQYQLNTCGCTKRDADHDGVACDADCQ
ncbi:MAG: thermonuclease family protein [Candidatus Moraniibacteriota bacterium]